MAIEWSAAAKTILIDGSNNGEPYTFRDIVEYFEANPISTLVRPQDYGSDPSELCEGNACEWSGLNGFGTPEDDTSVYTINSQSIKAIVESVPTKVCDLTRIELSGVFLYIYIDSGDIANFSLYDEIEVKETTNWNIRTRIAYIGNDYLRAESMDGWSALEDWPTEYSGEIWKPLSLAWNDNQTHSDVNIADCNKILFSIKTDSSAAIPLLKNVALRNYSIKYQGANYVNDVSINSDWQDVEITIRDMGDIYWVPNVGYRGYWNGLSYTYFQFDGLEVGNTVWIDGLRFVQDEPNPTERIPHVYDFNVALTMNSGTIFKDFGFTLNMNLLESYPGINCTAANEGDIQFGDFDYEFIGEGGVFNFNVKSLEDTGGAYFNRCQFNNIIFNSPKYSYAVAGFGSIVYNYFRNCTIINNTNLFNAGANTFENIIWIGGRYVYAFPTSADTIDNFTVINVNTRVAYLRAHAVGNDIAIRNIKITDNTDKSYLDIAYIDKYNIGDYGYAFYNLDIEEVTVPRVRQRTNGDYNYCPIKIGFTLDAMITDIDGSTLEDATVSLINKDSSTVFSINTDSSGLIDTQDVILMENYDTETDNTYYYFDSSDNWIIYYPYTLSVSKDNYQTYTYKFMNEYSVTDDIVKNGVTYKISLQEERYIDRVVLFS